MDQMALENTGAIGNTDIAPKRPKENKRWCFTLNNYTTDDIVALGFILQAECSKYAFKKEKGKEGTNHLQGYFVLNKKRRLTAIKALGDSLNRCHLEICKGSDLENELYICKQDTSIDCVIYQYGYIKQLNLIQSLKVITELRPFQKLVMECIDIKDDRKIHWVFDAEGGKGKTQLMKYIDYHKHAICCSGGKDSDIYNLFWNYIGGKAKNVGALNNLDCFVYNVARNHTFKQYTLLENIKDGFLTNSMYECGTMNFNSPSVVVLANHRPDMEAMTGDRWNIIEI